MKSSKIRDVFEEEVIFTAAAREARWRKIAYFSLGYGAIASILCVVTAIALPRPLPVVIPYDPATGSAVPMVNVRASSLADQDAVIQSLVYSYVSDRETYNQLDNDLRIGRVLDRSAGMARSALQAIWTSSSPDYPPTVYGDRTQTDVQMISITRLDDTRVIARFIKRVVSPNGIADGRFSATLRFEFVPAEIRDIEGVWNNPLGFKVSQYSVTAERFEAE